MPSPRSLAASVIGLVVLALAIPTALAKQCIYHFDANYKSILVWNKGIPDLNLCNYWRWHYQNIYTNLRLALPSLTHVCSKPRFNEIGFAMTTGLDQSPDRLFTDQVCNVYTPSHILPFITTTGWTCVAVRDLEQQCKAQGNAIIIPGPEAVITTVRPVIG
ncbi:hypothetical protein HDU96_002989 [Phlyctochytrium bullatum]|nr:hypothetical protein HDU96_002989 [Phlyctochytrium bullatum]